MTSGNERSGLVVTDGVQTAVVGKAGNARSLSVRRALRVRRSAAWPATMAALSRQNSMAGMTSGRRRLAASEVSCVRRRELAETPPPTRMARASGWRSRASARRSVRAATAARWKEAATSRGSGGTCAGEGSVEALAARAGCVGTPWTA